jgi:hypothetical protein
MLCSDYSHYDLWKKFSSKKEHFNHNREHLMGILKWTKFTRALTVHIQYEIAGAATRLPTPTAATLAREWGLDLAITELL